MHAQEGYSTYFVCSCVCLCVCPEFADFISTLYDKMNIPTSFSLVFLGFQLADFDIKL